MVAQAREVVTNRIQTQKNHQLVLVHKTYHHRPRLPHHLHPPHLRHIRLQHLNSITEIYSFHLAIQTLSNQIRVCYFISLLTS